MQAGAGEATRLADAAYKDVAILDDRNAMVADVDVVVCVQPPALAVIESVRGLGSAAA